MYSGTRAPRITTSGVESQIRAGSGAGQHGRCDGTKRGPGHGGIQRHCVTRNNQATAAEGTAVRYQIGGRILNPAAPSPKETSQYLLPISTPPGMNQRFSHQKQPTLSSGRRFWFCLRRIKNQTVAISPCTREDRILVRKYPCQE
jgi:hypothetical protein